MRDERGNHKQWNIPRFLYCALTLALRTCRLLSHSKWHTYTKVGCFYILWAFFFITTKKPQMIGYSWEMKASSRNHLESFMNMYSCTHIEANDLPQFPRLCTCQSTLKQYFQTKLWLTWKFHKINYRRGNYVYHYSRFAVCEWVTKWEEKWSIVCLTVQVGMHKSRHFRDW